MTVASLHHDKLLLVASVTYGICIVVSLSDGAGTTTEDTFYACSWPKQGLTLNRVVAQDSAICRSCRALYCLNPNNQELYTCTLYPTARLSQYPRNTGLGPRAEFMAPRRSVIDDRRLLEFDMVPMLSASSGPLTKR